MQISYHSILTKIQKLQNLKKKKKKKKKISVLAGTPGTGRYCPKLAGTAGIFSGTKQGGRVYRIAGRYGTELITLVLNDTKVGSKLTRCTASAHWCFGLQKKSKF